MTKNENEDFWNEALERFVGAQTAKLSAIALAKALESKEPMPEWVRDVFAMMIQGRWRLAGPLYEKWTLNVVERRDIKRHVGSVRRQQIGREVGLLVQSGHSKADAFRQVSEKCNLTLRAVEKIYASHKALFREIRDRVRARKNA
jgi:hypothetical protein